MFIIISGRLEVVRDIDKGRPQFVASLGPGEFFGEIASVKDVPRSASVRAVEQTRCLVIWRADFDAFIAQFPEAAANIEAAAKARLADSGQSDH
jgi:CRP/FNR family transcriptional regulator/voltage-gated potassium channel